MSTSVNIDQNYLTKTLTDLVRINSCNPALSPQNPGEGEISAYIGSAMADIGLDVKIDSIAPGRSNAIGIMRSNGTGRSLMWNAHTDTVGVEGMPNPFSAEIRDGKVYGRGSQDMKGSLAAMLTAAKALQEAGIALHGDLILSAVADEEHASLGAQDLINNYRADAAIVTEPTGLKLCRAHRGFIWYDIETYGRAAHGSRYEEGIDAIMHMGRFLAKLEKLEKELRLRSPHPLAGPPSLHASLIKGGSEISTYAAHCRLQVERRTAPEETTQSATAELKAIAEALTAADPKFNASIKPSFERPPFSIEQNTPIVTCLDESIYEHFGTRPQHSGVTFWTDAALFANAGIQTVLIGPHGNGLHSVEEWVDLQSCIDLAHILVNSAMRWCVNTR